MSMRAFLRGVLAIGAVWSIGQAAASDGMDLTLTSDELAWIKQHPVLRVSVLAELEPIEYLEGGRLRGLSAAYLDTISRKTGLRFTYVPAKTSQERVDTLERGEADLISAMRINGEVAQASDLLFTQPYHLSAGIVVTRVKRPFLFEPEQLNGMTVTLPYLQRYSDELRRKAPNATLIMGGSARKMLEQVADGTADVAIGTEGYLMPYLYSGYQGQLQVAGVMAGMTTEVGMGVRRDQTVLFSIVQKTLASISSQEVREMQESWLAQHMNEVPTFSDLTEHFPHEIALVVAVLLLLAGIAFQTYRMRQKAVRNEREKTMFLAVMSHEIRSPMNAVLAAVELLRNTPLDKQQQNYADLANSGAHSLLTLIDDVLDVTKLEAGKMKLELEPVDIAALVRNVVDLNQLRAREKSISLSYDGDIEPPLLMLDDTRLMQVLNNLVSNAIKFTETGGVTLRYAVADSNIPRHVQLLMVVSDTGIGISEEAQARLFQPYAQAARSFKRSGGTGLGLVISRDLVNLMQGRISLTSKEGKGTVIEVSIPVLLAPRNAAAPEVEPRSDPSRPSGGLRILVVEDTPANQAVLQAQLEGFGCTAVIAQDGAQALACFSQGRYDLVLMDCDLPDTDGYALTTKLRLMELDTGQDRCPIIAISASTGAEHVTRCFDSGMDGILNKPIRMGKLQDTIELWCGVAVDPITAPSGARGVFGTEQVIEVLQQDLYALLQSVALRDADGARRAAHRLRGASLTVDWPEVADSTAAAESLFQAGTRWDDPALLEQLRKLARNFHDTRPVQADSRADGDRALATPDLGA
ncbi:MAG: ATP-binding protein [Pseudomonadales bacterium]